MAVDVAQSIRPDIPTRLAFDRTRVAYDRTMMAWIRTATSLITFGFSIFKFFQFELGGARQDRYLIGPREFALSMVSIGLISLLLGTIEHRQNMRSLKAQWLGISHSQTGVLAALISALGILALIAVILRKSLLAAWASLKPKLPENPWYAKTTYRFVGSRSQYDCVYFHRISSIEKQSF